VESVQQPFMGPVSISHEPWQLSKSALRVVQAFSGTRSMQSAVSTRGPERSNFADACACHKNVRLRILRVQMRLSRILRYASSHLSVVHQEPPPSGCIELAACRISARTHLEPNSLQQSTIAYFQILKGKHRSGKHDVITMRD
jgi:hypothetical protein